jgi:hypothetical protein
MYMNKTLTTPTLVITASICLFPVYLPLFADDTPGHVHDDAQALQTDGQAGGSIQAMQQDHAAMGHTMADASEGPATAYTTDTQGLPEANPTETVLLKDGDTYAVTASYVKKQVGNRTLRMLAYNGSVPGPFIKAAQNS